jgi:hypothetical protein
MLGILSKIKNYQGKSHPIMNRHSMKDSNVKQVML